MPPKNSLRASYIYRIKDSRDLSPLSYWWLALPTCERRSRVWGDLLESRADRGDTSSPNSRLTEPHHSKYKTKLYPWSFALIRKSKVSVRVGKYTPMVWERNNHVVRQQTRIYIGRAGDSLSSPDSTFQLVKDNHSRRVGPRSSNLGFRIIGH